MKDYEINDKTLAIVPLGKRKSLVYEDHDCYILEHKTCKLMDRNCQFNGSSMEGRVKGTYNLTGYTYKAPIILSETKDIIFFPTSSPRLHDCAWISSKNIKRIYDKSEKCIVEFLNDEFIEIDSSYRILSNQYHKSLELQTAFKNRKIN